MKSYSTIFELIKAGLKKITCDLELRNVNLVNVYSSEIYNTNVYIKNKRIVSIDPNVSLESKNVIDCRGQYAVPGLIDSHMHIESTYLSPWALSEVLVPQGTTTICADLHEIGNVAGVKGISTVLSSSLKLPYRILLEIPSRVPTAPGLETTGGVIGLAEVQEMLNWKQTVSLGELDSYKVLHLMKEYLKKIAASSKARKIVNGHAPKVLGHEINIYASSGISDDHECIDYDELLDRIRVGMTVLVREGSTERNLETLIKGVVKNHLSYEHLSFCTDDKDADQIKNEGHINYNVSKAISIGVPPIKAIQMATINTARHFHIEDEIGSVTPGRLADILLVRDLNQIKPTKVIFEGQIVAEDGKLITNKPVLQYPSWIKNSIKLKNSINAKSFTVYSKKNFSVRVNVIGIQGEQIINKWLKEELPVRDGKICNSLKKDILKLAVVERYGKNGNVGIAFVKGFGLKRGALASSISHDHHNIVTVGTNDSEMAVAINSIYKMQGGFVVVENGKVKAELELRIGGLMSEKNATEVIEKIEELNSAAKTLGCTLPAPFMSLSFVSLPTVPQLGLTDMGLVDVVNRKLINVEIEE
jgi:adenine deaminase